MSCDRYPQPGHTNPTADESGSLPVADLHPEFSTSKTVAGLGGFVVGDLDGHTFGYGIVPSLTGTEIYAVQMFSFPAQ